MSDTIKAQQVRDRIFEVISDFEKNIRVQKDDDWKVCICCLYFTIIAYAESILTLYEEDMGIAIPVILRSMIEACVDLSILCEDRNYLKNMDAAFHSQFIRKSENIPEWQEEKAESEARIDQLKSEGSSSLSIFKKFKRASMEEIYKDIYSYLCQETHNNYVALYNRHLRGNQDDASYNVMRFAPRPSDYEKILNIKFLEHILLWINHAAESINEALGN